MTNGEEGSLLSAAVRTGRVRFVRSVGPCRRWLLGRARRESAGACYPEPVASERRPTGLAGQAIAERQASELTAGARPSGAPTRGSAVIGQPSGRSLHAERDPAIIPLVPIPGYGLVTTRADGAYGRHGEAGSTQPDGPSAPPFFQPARPTPPARSRNDFSRGAEGNAATRCTALCTRPAPRSRARRADPGKYRWMG